MKRLNTFILHTDYAESSSVAAVLLVHNVGFDTVEEGLVSIRLGIQEGLKIEGTPIESMDAFEEYWRNDIHGGDLQTFPYECSEQLANSGWDIIPISYNKMDPMRGVVVHNAQVLVWTAGSWVRPKGDWDGDYVIPSYLDLMNPIAGSDWIFAPEKAAPTLGSAP